MVLLPWRRLPPNCRLSQLPPFRLPTKSPAAPSSASTAIPLMETPAGLREADLTILGMGKLGGRELNFSSDIDIIYFYSADAGETTGIPDGVGGVKGKISLHAFFVKLAEMITKAVSQVTADGFVFRVDLGLRPEGKERRHCRITSFCRDLLRIVGTIMGAGCPAEGPAGSRIPAPRRAVSRPDRALHLPEIPRLHADRRHHGDEKENRCISGPGEGRRVQYQTWTRRHPGDRVLHSGAATCVRR